MNSCIYSGWVRHRRHAPRALAGVAAVSPIIEVGECTKALERPENALYQWNFVRDLKRRIRRKERFNPGLFDLRRLSAVKTVREFDDVFTAPYFGFRNAGDYYRRASAMRVIDRIAVPALVITAEDDPFVPYVSFVAAKISANPAIQFVAPQHGGHCGFISNHPGPERFWAEQRIVDFCAALRVL